MERLGLELELEPRLKGQSRQVSAAGARNCVWMIIELATG